MNSDRNIKIIPKEDAVFWMDGNGVWHNEHGPFEHPKIITYFNRSIQKDELGYFVSQDLEGTEERVYFPHEETAVFAVDIRKGDPVTLVLNTGAGIPVAPEQLYIENDALFMESPKHLIKFNQQTLAKMAGLFTETGQGLALVLNGKSYVIPEK
ncbi:MAG TPA: MFS transporter permease [Desulfobacteraceae bacterium]|nr:MFS transporter permease [Desulfobacteraceae bacterium]|tara:strand:- start:45 stop:506 length:462 start_codon:yes stop_codon:yes gene_type:complete